MDEAAPSREGAVTDERWVAPGGWRRVVVGLAIGTAVGLLLGRVLPSDDG